MPWHQIKYSVFNCPADPSFPNGHIGKRPLLRLDLVNGTARQTCYAIADSGADHCTFPLSFALQPGFDPLTRVASNTAGVGNGAVPTFYWPVIIDFPGVISFEVYAGFTSGLENVGLGLLGQAGFFDKFKVVFDHTAGLFHVETPAPAQAPPSAP